MADFTDGIAEGVRRAFLAGVGAVAYGAEKTTALVDDLVKKGELTVDQGKDLNRELTVKAKATVDGAQETVLRARLATMTPEERAAFVAPAQSLASDLDAKEAAAKAEATKVEVEDGSDDAAGKSEGDDAKDAEE